MAEQGLEHERVPDARGLASLERPSLLELHFQPNLDHDPRPHNPKLPLVYLPPLHEVAPRLPDDLDQESIRDVVLADLLDFL